ncbi:MAG TPA: trehalose-6-phosphate synthase [Syntrophales bacterium]|nr:trehalose-6-phosphate synthase [Syntrophales bacterium]
MKCKRLVVVSNRLPLAVRMGEKGNWTVEPGSGGLVTALAPVLKNRGGLWIGWPGVPADNASRRTELENLLARHGNAAGYDLKPVFLTGNEVDLYYHGFSNEVLWPLFHDLFSHCNFRPEYWTAYRHVNGRFASVIARETEDTDYLWIHDYHLIPVARELKRRGIRRRTGFFLHIPFPPLDIFLKLPWRFELLDYLLAYDLIGFQTLRDQRNFIGCLKALRGCRVSGRTAVSHVASESGETRVAAFPISIDFREFSELARSEGVTRRVLRLRSNMGGSKIILGVDRLDYTKGIPHRLLAFENALRRFPGLRNRVTLVQIVVPSRTAVEEYHALKKEIERQIGKINGTFTDVGWVPIHYIYRSLTREELTAYYRASDIALVTPLKDGMNLVAKEYCASQTEENGLLILSEFAGTAAQFHEHALMVNPYDVEGTADAIRRACIMDPGEIRRRMRRLRQSVHRHDIYSWVSRFLRAGISDNLKDFPQLEFFIPRETALRYGGTG